MTYYSKRMDEMLARLDAYMAEEEYEGEPTKTLSDMPFQVEMERWFAVGLTEH